MSEQEFLTRGQRRQEPLDRGYAQEKKGDCGCNKPFPFSEILPRDASVIDFMKLKEEIAFAVTDVGIQCSNVLTYVNNIKDFYPEHTMTSSMDSVQSAVSGLEVLLKRLQNHLNERETKAREILEADGSWIQVHNK